MIVVFQVHQEMPSRGVLTYMVPGANEALKQIGA